MIPQVGVDVIKAFEGFHHVVTRVPVVTAVPYLCPASYWTIGYGILCQQNHPAITQEEGETMLKNALPIYMNHLLRLSPRILNESNYRIGALLSFIFNLGPTQYAGSTLRKRVNEENWVSAQQQIKLWIYGGGRVLPGLVARRELESLMLSY